MSDGSDGDHPPVSPDATLAHLDNNPNIRVWSESECAFYLGIVYGEMRRQMAIADEMYAGSVILALERIVRISLQIIDRLRVLSDDARPRGSPPR